MKPLAKRSGMLLVPFSSIDAMQSRGDTKMTPKWASCFAVSIAKTSARVGSGRAQAPSASVMTANLVNWEDDHSSKGRTGLGKRMRMGGNSPARATVSMFLRHTQCTTRISARNSCLQKFSHGFAMNQWGNKAHLESLRCEAVARVGRDDTSSVVAVDIFESIVAGVEERLSSDGIVIGFLRRENVSRVLNARRESMTENVKVSACCAGHLLGVCHDGVVHELRQTLHDRHLSFKRGLRA